MPKIVIVIYIYMYFLKGILLRIKINHHNQMKNKLCTNNRNIYFLTLGPRLETDRISIPHSIPTFIQCYGSFVFKIQKYPSSKN